jgi:hypothetical protein
MSRTSKGLLVWRLITGGSVNGTSTAAACHREEGRGWKPSGKAQRENHPLPDFVEFAGCDKALMKRWYTIRRVEPREMISRPSPDGRSFVWREIC